MAEKEALNLAGLCGAMLHRSDLAQLGEGSRAMQPGKGRWISGSSMEDMQVNDPKHISASENLPHFLGP